MPVGGGEPGGLVTVVGAVVRRHGRLLAARRSRPPVGWWEFPGGKVEPGETVEQAVVREVREELGCTVAVGTELLDRGHPWPISSSLVLRLFEAELADGEPSPGDSHDAVRWLLPHELDELDWLPSDRRAVDTLLGSPDESPARPRDDVQRTPVTDSPQPVDPFLLEQLGAETEARAAGAVAPFPDSPGAPADLLAEVWQAVGDLTDSLVTASHDLADHPEVAFEEHRSAEALATLVESHGIAVTRAAYGLPTALEAVLNPEHDGPTVALMSEYDALPGLGHGCGHNVIATTGVGAFLALVAVRDRLPGRVVWLGTPAEEGGGGKELMARAGALDGVDAAVMVHPFGYDVAEPVFLGRRQLRATFTGITSHASAQPFMGRNALDAVNLMYTGVALHRQQMPPTDRVHGVVTAGGERPNVIPERGEILFYLRSEYPEALGILSDRLADIARGAALMTGCGVELTWDEAPAYLPIRGNGALAASWSRRYAERGRRVLPAGVLPSLFAGSTDFGNVSFRVPAVHAMVKITTPEHGELSLHTREFAEAAVGPEADQVVSDASYALAAVAADYLCDDDLRAAARADFETAGGAIDVPAYFDRD